MLGPGASLFMSVVIFLYIWGSATAYLIILGDCFAPLLAGLLGQAWYTQRDVVILAISCATILPLCFPRTLSAIAGENYLKGSMGESLGGMDYGRVLESKREYGRVCGRKHEARAA
jgi:amino acid permease